MRKIFNCWSGSFTALLLLAIPGWPAAPCTFFGLNHTPLGGAVIDTSYGTVRVTPGPVWDGESGTNALGVSVELGEADSGIFGYLDTYNSLNWSPNSMIGRVYGQLDGEPDQFLCSLGVVNNGDYEVTADFSPLGATRVTYQVFNGPTLVATETNALGPVRISTWSESSPAANPFWKLPDGSVAAVVQLSCPRTIRLPNWVALENDHSVEGDRILIRAENASGVVDFASRVDVTVGGGEDLIVITQERLGVFNHAHKALGEAILDAAQGELTVARLHPENAGEEIGVSIALEEFKPNEFGAPALEGSRQFGLTLQPQDLTTNGATLVASAIGSDNHEGREFLGYAAVRNQGGALQVFADFAFLANGLQISVLRNGCLVGTELTPASSATVNVSRLEIGAPPLVRGFEGVAETGLTHAGLAVQLDRSTIFTLPDGSSLEGDQVRFSVAEPTILDRLVAFNLTASNLNAFTVTAETRPPTMELVDYLPDVSAPALLKKFTGAEDGAVAQFIRSSTRTNRDGRQLVVLTDRTTATNSLSASFSLQGDGLHFHGYAQEPLALDSAFGLRVLPNQLTVGQTYFSRGDFVWHDLAAGQDYPVEVDVIASVVALEPVTVPAGTFSALRLVTVTTFSGSGATNTPTVRISTNWLAAGGGVIKFTESEVFPGEARRIRSGELTDFAILTTQARTHTANVGANVVLRAEVLGSPAASIVEWQKDGVGVSESASDWLNFYSLRYGDAGRYSVVLRLPDGAGEITTMGEVADLRVIPFSDSPPFWSASAGSSSSISVAAAAADGAGDVYVAGTVNGNLTIRSNTLSGFGYEDAFVMKLDPAGQVVWVRRAGGTSSDYARAMGLDAAGNVYLAGVADGPASFGSLRLTSPGIYVTKLDSNGSFLWIASAAFTGNSYSRNICSLAVDRAGNQYAVGYFYQGTISFGTHTLTNASWSSTIFVAKLAPNGQWLWARQFSEGGYTYPAAAVLNGAGELYLAGGFQGTVTLGNATLRANPSYYESGFLAKTDPDGNPLWTKMFGTHVRTLALDRAGDLCLSGEFYDTLNLDGRLLFSPSHSGSDGFLAKVTPDGVSVWARNSPHLPGYDPTPLTLDSADNIYLAGSFYNQAAYDGTTFLKPSSSSTIITKLNPQGQLLWHKQITGSGENIPAALATGNAGNVYLAGKFRNQIAFGETVLTQAGYESAFVVQITGATPPTVTQQPQPQMVNLGEPVTFNIAATGTSPLSYQWRKDGFAIAGATAPSLTLSNVQWCDRGNYMAVVQNAGGLANSDSAALQVLASDAGTVIFAGTNYALVETNTQLLVNVWRTGSTSTVATVDFRTAEGTATVGQDYWATVVSLRFAPGETLKTVAVHILDDSVYESTETVVLRLDNPGAGTVVGSPDTTTITITDNDPPGLPVIRYQPVSHTVAVGAAVTFRVTADGAAPLLYQWRKDGADLGGATNRIFTISQAQLSDAGSYSVVVSNAAGEAVSSNATLTVIPPPVILVQPQSQIVPYGESVTFSVVATSCWPVVTQVFTRVSSGSGTDTNTFTTTGTATLYIHYDFRVDVDTLEVYLNRYPNDEEPYFLGSTTTNGTGIFVVNYTAGQDMLLRILVRPLVEGGGDGWSYRAEDAVSPLTYRWVKLYEEGSYCVGSGSSFTLGYAQFADAGTYSVTVSDPIGSVVSDPVTLNVVGPLLRIASVPCTNDASYCVQLSWRVSDYHLEIQESPEDEWYDVPGAYSGMIYPVIEGNPLFRLARTVRPD